MVRFIGIVLIFLQLFPCQLEGGAAVPNAPSINPLSKSTPPALSLVEFERYLNSIKSLQSSFVQINQNGTSSQGSLSIQRPGYLRLEYDASVPLLIVADGHRLISYDKELDETTTVSIDSSLAGFLLRDPIQFKEDILVKDVTTAHGVTRIELTKKEAPSEGSLTLVFENSPITLKQWIVKDAQGNTTRVNLVDLKTGVSLNPELFKIKRPL